MILFLLIVYCAVGLFTLVTLIVPMMHQIYNETGPTLDNEIYMMLTMYFLWFVIWPLMIIGLWAHMLDRAGWNRWVVQKVFQVGRFLVDCLEVRVKKG